MRSEEEVWVRMGMFGIILHERSLEGDSLLGWDWKSGKSTCIAWKIDVLWCPIQPSLGAPSYKKCAAKAIREAGRAFGMKGRYRQLDMNDLEHLRYVEAIPTSSRAGREPHHVRGAITSPQIEPLGSLLQDADENHQLLCALRSHPPFDLLHTLIHQPRRDALALLAQGYSIGEEFPRPPYFPKP